MSRSAMILLCFTIHAAGQLASIPWNYDPSSGDGPQSWAERSIECNNASVCYPYPYLECAGQAQSPLNIIDDETEVTKSAFMHLWRSVNSSDPSYDPIYNDGHDIIIDMLSSRLLMTTSMFSEQMVLVNIIHKVPSEHTLNGVRYDIEQQLVFRPSDASTTDSYSWTADVPEVRVSLLYTVTDDQPPDPNTTPDILSQIMSHFPRLPDTGDALFLFKFIPWFDLTHDIVYTYEGSNTSPPCEQRVQWIVSSRIRAATKAQAAVLHQGLQNVAPGPNGNARPVMPLHGRRIYKRRLMGPSKKPIFFELAMRMAETQVVGSVSNGTIIRSSPASTSSKFRKSLEDAVVGLAVVLVLLVCGLAIAALLRKGFIPLTIIPTWLGGIAEPARERWTTSSKEIFGFMISYSTGGDIEDELEEDEEGEEDEEEEDEEEEEED